MESSCGKVLKEDVADSVPIGMNLITKQQHDMVSADLCRVKEINKGY